MFLLSQNHPNLLDTIVIRKGINWRVCACQKSKIHVCFDWVCRREMYLAVKCLLTMLFITPFRIKNNWLGSVESFIDNFTIYQYSKLYWVAPANDDRPSLCYLHHFTQFTHYTYLQIFLVHTPLVRLQRVLSNNRWPDGQILPTCC